MEFKRSYSATGIPFRLTGEVYDPSGVNLDIIAVQKGYYKEEKIDVKGDISEIGYYLSMVIDENDNEVYSEPVVKELRTYTRAVGTGLVTKCDIEFRYYFEDNDTDYYSLKGVTKHFNSIKGHKANITARENLLHKASMWLYKDLINQVGIVMGDTHAKEFLVDIGVARSVYMIGNRQPILDIINNSNRGYMTPARKSTLTSILNVAYA